MDGAHITAAEATAHRLLSALVEAVPGDLGHIVRTIVQSGESSAYARPPYTASSENGLTAGHAFNHHSGPIPWAPRVLALCCQAYNRPVEMVAPVGACLELL